MIWRRVAATERYALAMAALGAGTWHWDRRSGAIDWDPALEALYGLPEGGFGGTLDEWMARIHPDDRAAVMAEFEGAVGPEDHHAVVYRIVKPDGTLRWIEGRGKAIVDEAGEVTGMVGACRDVTDRQEAERERSAMLEAERRARQRLQLLAEASDILARSPDIDETVHELARLAVPRLGDWCLIELIDRQDREVSALAHGDPAKLSLAREFRRRFGSVTARAEELLTDDGYFPEVTEDHLRDVASDPEHLEALRRFQVRSAIVVPLQARNQPHGLLALAHAESGRRHSHEDYTLAAELARRTASAVDNARLFAERSRVARVLQRALLPPKLPSIPGIDIASHYDTAEATDIGGDFYDAIGAGDEWTLVVGDVGGKGVEAASLASLARHTVRAAALRDPDPGQILSVLNDALIEHDPIESFCTAVCLHMKVRPGEARIDLAVGGHPPPLVLRPDGSVATLEASGPLIGLLPEGEYPVSRTSLGTGELLFLYTDGLTEARRGDELFGSERVEQALRSAAGMTAEATLKHIHSAMETFQAQQRDDVALLALRLMEPGTADVPVTPRP